MTMRLLGSAMLALSLVACAEPDAADELERESLEQELQPTDVVAAGTTLRVTASALNLRKSASTSSSVLDVLYQGETVTAASASGSNGWVNVKSGSLTGWVASKYVERTTGSASGSSSSSASAASCAASRAVGTVGRYQKALHDSIAFAEGTRNVSKDGYDVKFSGRTFTSCTRHPNDCIRYGSTCSTAAGRYQFLTGTWNSVKSARSLSSFEPDDQERGAVYLIGTVRKVSVPQERALSAAEFTNAMNKLSYEWASLPPGRYGQPMKSMSTMRSTYCSYAGC